MSGRPAGDRTANSENVPLWSDRTVLRQSQYRSEANLRARQSIYVFQEPRVHLPRAVLDLAGLCGDETVVDVGCGDGGYLAEPEQCGHRSPLVGVDLSTAMLDAARRATTTSLLLAADATMLPLRDGAGDVTLVMHMLYRVSAPAHAVAELRSVTRPGGQVMVVLKGDDHLAELRDLTGDLGGTGEPSLSPGRDDIRLDEGERLLREQFGDVARHDFVAELVLIDTGPVLDNLASTISLRQLPDPDRALRSAAARIVFDEHGTFRVRTHCGVLVAA